MATRTSLFALVVLLIAMLGGATCHKGHAFDTPEMCWPTAEICNVLNPVSLDYDSLYCWERCLCKGYRHGICLNDQSCRDSIPGRPWKCICRPSASKNKKYEETLRKKRCGLYKK